MRWMQIRLPDDVFERARKLCAAREISFAELFRRGLEYILSVYAAEPGTGEWQPPNPRRLGWKGLTDAQLKEQAHIASAEAAMLSIDTNLLFHAFNEERPEPWRS